jgi:hypothetical protein
MKNSGKGIPGVIIVISGSFFSLYGILLQQKSLLHSLLIVTIILIADILYAIGSYFILAFLSESAQKFLLHDTRNKFLYGFGMFIVTVILSFFSFVVPYLRGATWFSLIIASFFFVASILIIIALFRFGEATGIPDFKVSSWLFILMVIFPPYTGAGGMITSSVNSAFATVMNILGTLILIITMSFLISGFVKLMRKF